MVGAAAGDLWKLLGKSRRLPAWHSSHQRERESGRERNEGRERNRESESDGGRKLDTRESKERETKEREAKGSK